MPKSSADAADEPERSLLPPLRTSADGVEVHPHRIGHRMFDLIVAGSAILISVISLIVAIEHGRSMQKLVAASSWPLLQYASGNTDDQNRSSINLSITNAGVGPAMVKRFRLLYRGRSYDNAYKFLWDCCGYSVRTVDPTKHEEGVPLTSMVEASVIRGGDTATYLLMPLAASNKDAWKKLDRARFEVKFDACYCSVLGECWNSDLRGLDPKSAKACPPAEATR